jgi:phosphohistidine phosphatase
MAIECRSSIEADRILSGQGVTKGVSGFLMLRLVLFRHGQAVPHDQGPDSQRSLTATGQRESGATAKALAEGGIVPDLVLVSSATRTRETWDNAKSYFSKTEMRLERDLYLATPDVILSLLHALDAHPKTVMIVGHNPSLHDFALECYGFGDRYAFARLRDEFPTAACAVFDFDVPSWVELSAHKGRLDRFLIPPPA